MSSLLLALAASTILFASSAGAALATPSLPTELNFLLSSYRQDHRLSPLKTDETLCEFARVRVKEIKTDWSHNGFWQHRYQFFKDHQEYQRIGENLARGYSTAQQIIKAWDASPTHKENLIASDYNRVCHVADGEYVVEVFGAEEKQK